MSTHYEPFHETVHERSLPHPLAEGIWMWSIFNEERVLHFNGYLVKTEDNRGVIIDPVCDEMDPRAVLAAFEPLPQPTAIWLTNRDHERAAQLFKAHFQIPVLAPEEDARLLDVAPDRIFRDGETLDGGWQVIGLQSQKSPGESALYHPERRLLILGDALIGKPMRYLSMLPAEKYADAEKARLGLQRLAALDVEAVLPCDGDPVFYDACNILRDTIRLE